MIMTSADGSSRAGISTPSTSSSTAIDILVVEDEAIVAMELVARLEDLGYRVCGVADNGIDAIALAHRERPALVLLDVVLRGAMDGVEVSRHLVDSLALPVIFLTAHNDGDTVQRAAAVAPYGYLTKPFQAGELRAAIEVALYKAEVDRTLRKSERWYQAMLRSVADGVVATDSQGTVTFMNPAAEGMTGWGAEEALGQSVHDVVVLSHRHTGLPIESPMLRAMRRREAVEIDFGTILTARGGTRTPIDDSAAPIRDAVLGELGAVMAFRDVGDRVQLEEALYDSEAWFRSTFELAPGGMLLTDSEGLMLQANHALCRLVGRHGDDLIERSRQDLTHPEDRDLERAQLDRLQRGGVLSVEFENRLLHASGREIPVHAGVTLLERAGESPRFLFQYHDLSLRKEAEARLAHLAQHDLLTGLPNRARLHEEMQHLIAAAQRQGQRLAVLFLDLDLFKQVNDTLGHEAGDRLLQVIAQRLRNCVRETDCVGRLGGDEFVVVLSDIHSAERAGEVAGKISASVRQILDIAGREVAVDASIGIALYPDDGEDGPTLLRCADSALYHAKDSGRGQTQFYRLELTERVARRLDLAMALRLALENEEFELAFQPVVSVADGRVLSAEALVRWRRPSRELVMPDAFIGVAEEIGLIDAIGAWVIDAACRAASEWPVADGRAIDVAVNVSPRQFRSPGLVDTIRGALDRTGLAADRLVVEITEQALLEATDQTESVLRRLRALGVRVMIDDFGIGYSSLGYLQRFAPDGLKIDRSFIRDVTVDESDAAIVSAVLAMALRLGLDTVAEGVETDDQLDFLRREGCNTCQGYLFAPPLSSAGFHQWLEGRTFPMPAAAMPT